MPRLSTLENSPSASTRHSAPHAAFDDEAPFSSPEVLGVAEDDDVIFPPSPPASLPPAQESLFLARSDDGSSDGRRSPVRSFAGTSSSSPQKAAEPSARRGAPLSAKGKARQSVASAPPKGKIKAPALPASKSAVKKPAIMTKRVEGKTQTAIEPRRRETDKDGFFTCKVCGDYTTKLAADLEAHWRLCLKGLVIDRVQPDASSEEPSEDEDDSAASSEDDYQRVVKTTAQKTRRKQKAPEVKKETGIDDVKPPKRPRKVKAVGISGGSRINKPPSFKKQRKAKPPTPSPSSSSPSKRKAPPAPVPSTARPSKVVKVEVAKRRPPTKQSQPSSVASSSRLRSKRKKEDEEEIEEEGQEEDHLTRRGTAGKHGVTYVIDGEAFKIQIDEEGAYHCPTCYFWSEDGPEMSRHIRVCKSALRRK